MYLNFNHVKWGTSRSVIILPFRHYPDRFDGYDLSLIMLSALTAACAFGTPYNIIVKLS